MISPLVNRKIEYLGEVITDLKILDEEIESTNDVGLLYELEEEKIELLKLFDDAALDCMSILEAYMQDCKDEGIPVYLDYKRVLNELKKAKRLGLIED